MKKAWSSVLALDCAWVMLEEVRSLCLNENDNNV